MIEFQVLGEVAIRHENSVVTVPTLMLQRLVAVLACRAGNAVAAEAVADAVWAGAPPRTARKTLQVYVHRLRKVLGDENRIGHTSAGYSLSAQPDEIDSRHFERLVAAATAARSRGELGAARDLLESALGLWRGPAFSNLRDIPMLLVEAERLEERRLIAYEERAAIDLELGRHAELIGDLARVAKEHPYRERFHGQLMLALYRNGQRADALEVYRQARGRLVDELGVEPVPEVQRLHQQILASDPSLAAPAPIVAGTAAWRFLPPDIPDFTGRDQDIAWLDQHAQGPAQTIVINAITGMAGIGKTALAVRWSHRAAQRYPGGQLYVNLRGYDTGQPLQPLDALVHLLRCLGMPPSQIPSSLDDAAARYRSLVAGKQMLVLLDNARTADQVRPLLPGDSSCFTVITSRDRLSGLIAKEGARRLTLGLLAPQDAIALLRLLIGPERVDAEPVQVESLTRLCAFLPLALRIAAAHLVDRPEQTIADYTTELAGGDRIESLSIADDEHHAVGAVLNQSVRALAPQLQDAFRLLAIVPGPDFTAEAAAAVLDCSPGAAAETLEALATAHLLEPNGAGRYAFHDLIHDLALTMLDKAGHSTQEPRRRLFVCYRDAAAQADAAISASPGAGEMSTEDALRWLTGERANLVDAVSAAAQAGLPEFACDIAKSLWHAFHYTGHTGDWIATFECAVAAVSQTDDLTSRYFLLNALGQGYSRAGDYERALEIHRECLEGRTAIGDLVGAARSRCNIAISYERQGLYHQAIAEIEPALQVLHDHGELLMEAGNRATGLVNCLLRIGETERARDHLLNALEVLRELGTPFDTVRALFNLGRATLLLGDATTGLRYAIEAQELALKLGDRTSEAITLDLLSSVHSAQGDYQTSIDVRLLANEKFRELGIRGAVCEGLNDLARTYMAAGMPESARPAFAEALAMAEEIDSHHQRGRARAGLGELMRDTDPDAARLHLREAVIILAAIAPEEADAARAHLSEMDHR